MILLTGKIGCGKTTVQKIIKEQCPHLKDVNFSDALKKFAIMVGFTTTEIYGNQEEKLHVNNKLKITGREFMQVFGTEIGRNIVKQFFPDTPIEKYGIWILCLDKEHGDNPNLLIGDGRFQNEVEYVKDKGGIVINIFRPNNSYTSNHSSEQQELYYDYQIVNDGTLEDLESKVKQLISFYK
jgi:spore germination protein GerM